MKKENDVHQGILDDLIQGKEYVVIAVKWEVSERHVQNLASKYRKQGYDIPEQRSKDFKMISIIKYERV